MVHALTGLGVANQQRVRLTADQPGALPGREWRELATVNGLNRRQILVHPTVAQVQDDCCRFRADVLQQGVGLLDLRPQCLAVVWVAWEAPRAHHQPALLRDSQADHHAKLEGLARLALAEVLALR